VSVGALVACAALVAIGADCTNRAGHAAAPAPRTAAPAGEPGAGSEHALRLVVLIVLDQLPTWSFERDTHLLDHGIGTLLRKGIYYEHGEYPFAATHTATGHAALGTGAPPSVNGILGTEWYRRESGEEESCVRDPEYPIFVMGGDGAGAKSPPQPGPGASGRQLRVEGVADVLRRETSDKGRSVSIAVKQRAAILATGRRPDLAVWYDPGQMAMTTSAYYAVEPPHWLAELATAKPIRAQAEHYVWEPLDVDLLAHVTGLPDDSPGEGEWYGLDSSFPHSLKNCKNKGTALLATPLGNEILVQTALAAIEGEGLGADSVPDLLSVSFSSHDYVGHVWGQESWEHLDSLLRMDRSVGEILDALDREVGSGRYAVILTSDHGATHMVEQSTAQGLFAKRVTTAEILDAANAAARGVLGDGDWIVSFSASTLYMSRAFARIDAATRNRTLDAIVNAVSAVKGIGFVARTDRVAGGCDKRTGVEAEVCWSVVPEMSGEIYVATAPHSLLSDYPVGTGHGSPNLEDIQVPVILFAPGVEPREVSEPVSMLRIAPTLARLLGISRPEASTALPLP